MCCNEGHGHRHHHHRRHECGCGENCDCKSSECECGEGCHCQDGGCQCDCGGGRFRRRYQTKAEQISELEEYLAELKAEAQAVEERLADLR
jgi:hypothetical protein